jgi:hypothetical protein
MTSNTRRGGCSCARAHARALFACVMIAEGEPHEPTRTAYKALGYRLLATEGFFMQRLKRIPKQPPPVSIERVSTPNLAARLGKVTRTRPIPSNLLGDDAPFRQYVALDGEDVVGRVHSGSYVVCGHVCHPFASASRYRAGAAVSNVAGRPGARFEVLGADREPQWGASVSMRGL